MRILFRLAIDEPLQASHLLETANDFSSDVDIVFGTEQDVMGSESEELRRHFTEAMTNDHYIEFLLTASYHQAMDELVCPSRKIGTTVIKDDQSFLEVMDDFWCPVWIPDVAANAIEDKVFFCPQRIDRIERIFALVCLVVLDIIWSDD